MKRKGRMKRNCKVVSLFVLGLCFSANIYGQNLQAPQNGNQNGNQNGVQNANQNGIQNSVQNGNNQDNGGKETATALTIYSSATPGAISPELYRPIPGSDDSNGCAVNSAMNGSNIDTIPGFAIVRVQRDVNLQQPQSKISLSNVATLIDPTTVMVKSITDPEGTSVGEQDYRFDLVNQAKLLEKYLGLDIMVEQSHGTAIESYNGKLLSTSGCLILQDKDNKIVSIRDYSSIRFPDLPGGLITKPTLVWNIFTKKPGPHRIEASYQTGGITWWADYNAVFTDATGGNANSGTLDLNAWVSIINKTGASFEDVKLKLIAGNVNRIQGAQFPRAVMMGFAANAVAAAPPSFAEKPFFEFHLYTLDKPTTLSNNSTKQLELFPRVSNIPVEKQYIYIGTNIGYFGQINLNRNDSEGNKKVDVVLKFKNSRKNNLGIPLPAGRIRISKFDSADQTLEFVGEDTIDHTALDEEIKIKVGSAFDVVGERKQINFSEDSARRVMEETIEITLRNHKDQDVTVLVQENLYRGENWKIMDASANYEKIKAQTIQIPILVKKSSEATVKYTVRYNW